MASTTPPDRILVVGKLWLESSPVISTGPFLFLRLTPCFWLLIWHKNSPKPQRTLMSRRGSSSWGAALPTSASPIFLKNTEIFCWITISGFGCGSKNSSPLKGEKSAVGKNENNSIVLDYGGFPGLPLKPCLIKIQHVMHQFNNKGPYSQLLFLICTSPKWVWGWLFCLGGCTFNAEVIGAIWIHTGSLRLCSSKQQRRSTGQFSCTKCGTCKTGDRETKPGQENHIPPTWVLGCIPRGSIRK